MKGIAAVLYLAFTIRTSGQTPTTYTLYCPEVSLIPTVQSTLPDSLLGVVIESWRYDPADKIVILHLVNNSGKDATGFNISIAEKYADGSTNYVDGRPGAPDVDFTSGCFFLGGWPRRELLVPHSSRFL